MGTIVLMPGRQGMEISDGQQRLVTMTMILEAIARQDKTGSKSSEAVGATALRLSGAQGNAYMGLMKGEEIDPRGKLGRVWRMIREEIESRTRQQHEALRATVLTRTMYTVLTLDDGYDAHRVFEGINGRGMRLGQMELLKNHLYRTIEGELDGYRIQDGIQRCIRILGGSRQAEEYARSIAVGRYGHIRKERLYRDTRKAMGGGNDRRRDTVGFAQEMGDEGWAELYRNLCSSSPDPELVDLIEGGSGEHAPARNAGQVLNELRQYRIVRPLVFVTLKAVLDDHTNGDPQWARRVLEEVAAFMTRTVLSRTRIDPSSMESRLNELAHKVAKHGARTPGWRDAVWASGAAELQEDRWFQERVREMEYTDVGRIKRLIIGVGSACGEILWTPGMETKWKPARVFEARAAMSTGVSPNSIGNWILADKDDDRREARRMCEVDERCRERITGGGVEEDQWRGGDEGRWIRARTARLARRASEVWRPAGTVTR